MKTLPRLLAVLLAALGLAAFSLSAAALPSAAPTPAALTPTSTPPASDPAAIGTPARSARLGLTVIPGLPWAGSATSSARRTSFAPGQGARYFIVLYNPNRSTQSVQAEWRRAAGCGAPALLWSGELTVPPGASRWALSDSLPGDCAGFVTLSFRLTHNGRSLVRRMILIQRREIRLSSARISDTSGLVKDVFVPGQTLRYQVNSFNGSGAARTAAFTWTLKTACGTSTLWKGSLSVPAGSSAWTLEAKAPANCPGPATFSASSSYNSLTSASSSAFNILAYTVLVSDRPFFDACDAPDPGKLQTWMAASPYDELNLYIGGSLRYCANSRLNAAYLTTLTLQGWNFVPTWVGPQAECSVFKEKFSSDPATAYQQGRAQADLALAAAANLGLTANGAKTIIYYDLEAYPSTDTACKTAVNSFINGWSARQKELGYRSAAYGGTCSSSIRDWASISHPLDDIWAAEWYSEAKYRPNEPVWNLVCLANSYWPNNQRLVQYAGDHTETWGGVSLGIDSDIAGGHVAGANTRLAGAAAALELEPAPSFGLAAGGGWLLQPDSLRWSADGGDWQELTPADAQLPLRAAYLLDAQTGWLLDGGGLWRLTSGQWVRAAAPPELPGGRALLRFADAQTGWLMVKLPTSSNFNLGRLFRTLDGGLSWTELPDLPEFGELNFTGGLTGTLDGREKRWVTADGGASWQAAGPVEAQAVPPGLPAGVSAWQIDGQSGWAVVVESACSGEKGQPGFACRSGWSLWRTLDGGATWGVAVSP